MNNNLLKPDSSKQNFIFEFVYQAVILIIPLIVSPYLTRTLGSNALGIYTYTYSIAYYFVVFAMLGIRRHGQRIIAQRRENINSLRKTFWSLYFVHALASVLSLAVYLFYVLAICKSDVRISYIQAIYVFSALLDITWLFYGLEKFRIVAVRNAIVKVLETICIFVFVKSPSDLWIYTAIMCISVCVGQIIMMPQAIAAIPPIRFTWEEVREHIKPLFTLFAAVIATTLYTMFDKTLLGILSTKDNVAFYEYSDKIVKIPRTFVSVITTVLFPRACKYAADHNMKGMKKTMEDSLLFIYFIGFASVFGLLAVANLFSTVFYGVDFAACGEIMMSMTPLILIIGVGEVVRSSYIYPQKKDASMVRILFTNAVVNLIASIILIPVLGVYGAVVGTILAEMVGLMAELYMCRQYFSVKEFLATGIPFCIIGLIMFGIIKIESIFINHSISALVIQILTGIIVYLGLSFIYGFFFNRKLKDLIFNLFDELKKRLKGEEK